MVTAGGTRAIETPRPEGEAAQRARPVGPETPHLRLTVADPSLSAHWWCRTFGFVPVGPAEYACPTAPGYALIRHPVSGLVIGFLGRTTVTTKRGFEYLSLRVASERALRDWAWHLDRVGVAHSEVWGRGDERYLSFTAPDGIGVELWWVR
jgi:catechol 2,3-dioxygenase-like lactoylglutathione lyase family enzyme